MYEALLQSTVTLELLPRFFGTKQNIVNVQTGFNGSCDSVTWHVAMLLLRGLINFRVRPQMSWILCRRFALIYAGSTCGVSRVSSCAQVHAPARATVTRIMEAAPRSVRWSEDWSSAPVTLDIDWWMMAKPAKVRCTPVWECVYSSLCDAGVWAGCG